jgi:hypothetical protein
MVRNRSTLAILCRLALAYAVAFQALFGALIGPVFAGAVDSSLILCRDGGEGAPLPAGGDHPMRADHCAVMCQIVGGPEAQLAPEASALNLAPGGGRSELLALPIDATPDGARDRAPNARGPPRLG